MSTIDLFLDELKSEYDKEFELKSSLENKANYILIAAGVTMSLLSNFGAVLVDKLNADYQYLIFVVVFLMTGVVTNGISVLFSVLGFSIKPYRYPLPYHAFFTKEGMFNEGAIKQYSEGMGKDKPESEKIFKDSIIENYLRCIKQNAIQNKNKAIKIKITQWFFFAGTIAIPFIIGFVLPYLWSTPAS
jgi:hypothetical protein